MPKSIHSVPKVCHFNYDMKKQWYVHFRMNNPNTGERKQFRFSFGINYIKNKQERIYEANALVKALKEKLADGWCPFPIDEVEYETIYSALQGITAIKWESLRPRTKHSYKVVLDIFYEWIKRKGFDELKPSEFTSNEAMLYMDYLSTEKKLTGRTWNNRLSSMKIFFNYLVDRDLIAKNPFRKIKKQQESRSTRNYAFSDREESIVKDYLLNNEKALYNYIHFIYYCFLRPYELSHLKIGDIDLISWTITVRGECSKNKKTESVVIPNSMVPIIKSMNLERYDKDWYIFSYGILPGPERNKSYDKITPKHKKILSKLSINPNCTLYSWKATGVIKCYRATNNDIYSVMRQCRHHDISMTQIYMKSLGFLENNSVRNADY